MDRHFGKWETHSSVRMAEYLLHLHTAHKVVGI